MNDYIWTPSGTDITERWRRMGWTPPSEQISYQQKWSSYRSIAARSLSETDRKAIEPLMNVIQYPGVRK
jgi:hypothetical protein